MAGIIRLPSPPRDYDEKWANQYTRMLEAENQQLWAAIQELQTGGSAGLVVGTTPISGGTPDRLLYETSSNTLGEIALSGIAVTSFNAGTTGLTPSSSTTGAVTLAGTLAKANGGTGLTASRPVAQIVTTQTGAVATGTALITLDDTIPQQSEGTEFMTRSITPVSASSLLHVMVTAWHSCNNAASNNSYGSLYRDSGADALATVACGHYAQNAPVMAVLSHWATSGSTSATTFKYRAGPQLAATFTFNGINGARFFGGAIDSTMTITEYV